jgi:hypothetical protein
MSEKGNSVPSLSFEIKRQARIKRTVRGILRALAEWLRSLVLRRTQLTRRLAANRGICSDIRELRQFENRMLGDIGIITERATQFGGQIAAAKAQILSRANLLLIIAFRLCAAASSCLATAGATAAESATVVSPICAAADLGVTTLVEAHGEAQDVAPEILAQAFFTVMEARKACHQEKVEEASKLYESIPLPDAVSHSQ